MKKTVSFSKEIQFKTTISEITDIEVTHNLEKTLNNTIEGNFIVTGKYKMTDASQIEEEFSNELPFIIDVDTKYNLDDLSIKISDFFFSIINEDILKVNIEVLLDNLIEVEERCYDQEENLEDDLDIIEPIDILDKELPNVLEVDRPVNESSVSSNISDVFTSISNDEDSFVTYYVYIVRENDTIDDILVKYNVTREEISEYNDLDNIKVGSRIIIPSLSNE